jgi:gliding motility-associated-like protein
VNSCATISYTYLAPGTYTATQIVENSYGCRDTAKITIEILPEFNFYIPNAFTPTGNGLNDIFMPKIRGVKEYEFLIFDRWGQLFFKTNDITQGWDGTYKGSKCQQDVYVWKISFRDLVEMEYQTYVGHVTLIR